MPFFRLGKYLIFLIIGLWLETGPLNFIELWGATPDLILILVVIIALSEETSLTLIFAFFAGVLQDAFVTDFWGVSALSKISIGMFVGYFKRKDAQYTLPYFSILLIVSCAINEFISQLILSFGNGISLSRLVFTIIVPNVFYSSLFGVLVYLLFQGIIFGAGRKK